MRLIHIHPPGRTASRPLTLIALTGIGLAALAPAALAHVTVTASAATPGSYTTLAFRVPNESAKAHTVSVAVQFPADHPFASVEVRKQSGWTITTTTSKLAEPIKIDENITITEAGAR